jgi:hypothetical protein
VSQGRQLLAKLLFTRDFAKLDYGGNEFKTFQELEVPNDFNMLTAQQQLSSFTENYNKTLLSKISA